MSSINKSETLETVPFDLNDLVAPSSEATTYSTPAHRSSQILLPGEEIVPLDSTPIWTRVRVYSDVTYWFSEFITVTLILAWQLCTGQKNGGFFTGRY